MKKRKGMEVTNNLSRLKHVKYTVYIVLYLKEMGILLKVTSKAAGSKTVLFGAGDLKSSTAQQCMT